MAKISTYPSADNPLLLSDRLIGTEAIRPIPSSTPLATKNFSLGDLLQLFSGNFPAATLQAVLDAGNIATQNITLTGTIDTTLIRPDNIEDTSGSQGLTFQFLSKGTSSINWVDLPINNLQQVTTAGNTTTNSIIVEDNAIVINDNNNDASFEINGYALIGKDLSTNTKTFELDFDGHMYAYNSAQVNHIQSILFNTSGAQFQNYILPSKPTGNYTLATTSDITPAYTKYVCNFNATGTGAPAVSILENTLGNIVWTRNAVGDYRGTLSGAFPTIPKVWFSKPNTQYDAGNYGAFLSYISANVVQLLTTDYDQITPIDGAYNTSFEIRVYP